MQRPLGVLGVALLVAAMTACTIGDAGVGSDASSSALTPSESAAATTNSGSAPATKTAGATPSSTAVAALKASFASQEFSNLTVGLAIAPNSNTAPLLFGTSFKDQVAWSTSKVPLAIAALRAGGDAAVHTNVRNAIVNSDNAAAEALWSGLGSPATAAAAMQTVLRAGADTATTVNETVNYPGFTAFGQTVWRLNDAARFSATLPCLPEATPVLELMKSVAGNQQWGLQPYGAAVKGGWGPRQDGAYVVRQIGVLTVGEQHLGFAMGIVVSNGGLDAGIATLNSIGTWMHANLARIPLGRCAR